jgi:hypothetical protein
MAESSLVFIFFVDWISGIVWQLTVDCKAESGEERDKIINNKH